MASVRFHGIYMYISFLDLLVGVIYFAALYSIHWGLLFSVDGDYPTGIWVSLWPAFEVRVIRHRSGINCTYGNPKLTERQPRVAATIVSIFVGFPRVARAFQLQNISPDFRGCYQPSLSLEPLHLFSPAHSGIYAYAADGNASYCSAFSLGVLVDATHSRVVSFQSLPRSLLPVLRNDERMPPTP